MNESSVEVALVALNGSTPGQVLQAEGFTFGSVRLDRSDDPAQKVIEIVFAGVYRGNLATRVLAQVTWRYDDDEKHALAIAGEEQQKYQQTWDLNQPKKTTGSKAIDAQASTPRGAVASPQSGPQSSVEFTSIGLHGAESGSVLRTEGFTYGSVTQDRDSDPQSKLIEIVFQGVYRGNLATRALAQVRWHYADDEQEAIAIATAAQQTYEASWSAHKHNHDPVAGTTPAPKSEDALSVVAPKRQIR